MSGRIHQVIARSLLLHQLLQRLILCLGAGSEQQGLDSRVFITCCVEVSAPGGMPPTVSQPRMGSLLSPALQLS